MVDVWKIWQTLQLIVVVLAAKTLVSIEFIVGTIITRFPKDAKISIILTAAIYFTCYNTLQCCFGMTFLLGKRSSRCINVDGQEIEVVERFCYLGNMITPGRSWEAPTITWSGKFKEMLVLFSLKYLSLQTRGKLFALMF